MHLTAKPISQRGDSPWQVTHGDGEIIVAETNSADFVKDAIVALKMKGVPHDTHVVISTDAGSAWNGSIEQHPGA
jgi:hypothetical protein